MHDAPHPLLDQVQALGAGLLQGPISPRGYLHQLAQLLRRHFRCGQVSVWALCRQDGTLSATRLARDRDDLAEPPADDPVSVEGHQAYFECLRTQGYVASADTRADPVLHSVRERYLRHGAPRALLDVAFTVNGQAFGILCCEELSRTRAWAAEELAMLRRVASRVALHLNAHETRTGTAVPEGSSIASG